MKILFIYNSKEVGIDDVLLFVSRGWKYNDFKGSIYIEEKESYNPEVENDFTMIVDIKAKREKLLIYDILKHGDEEPKFYQACNIGNDDLFSQIFNNGFFNSYSYKEFK
jgi:hypothetical protein